MSKTVGIFTGVALWLMATSASAHIDLTSHDSRGGNQKSAPCEGVPRSGNVYTYKPGATINVTIAETIPHPGYFRIAFDDDGEDGFEIPAGTSGENGDCIGDPKCGPGMEDYCNNDTVLLDNLDPHPAGAFGQTKTYTYSVTLPNVECSNCTLQVIQMMNDFNFHPQPYPADDIYYRCIDLVLSNDADEVTETPVENNGMVCQQPEEPGPGPGPGMADAGVGGDPADAGTEMPVDMGPDPQVPAEPMGMQPGPGETPGDMAPGGTAGAPAPAEPGSPGPAPGGGDTATPGAPTAPTTAGGGDDGGCQISSAAPTGMLAPLGLALLVLGLRRRRA